LATEALKADEWVFLSRGFEDHDDLLVSHSRLVSETLEGRQRDLTAIITDIGAHHLSLRGTDPRSIAALIKFTSSSLSQLTLVLGIN